jgi:hypothetical protein
VRGAISVRGGDQSVSKERQNRGVISVNFYNEPLLSFTVISVNFTNKMGTGELGELEPRGEGNENNEIVEC